MVITTGRPRAPLVHGSVMVTAPNYRCLRILNTRATTSWLRLMVAKLKNQREALDRNWMECTRTVCDSYHLIATELPKSLVVKIHAHNIGVHTPPVTACSVHMHCHNMHIYWSLLSSLPSRLLKSIEA